VTLTQDIIDAWEVGQTIDLTGCDYGRSHVTGEYETTPSYYRLLAGLVRTQQMRSIIEVGTYCGGAARAMKRGNPDAVIATVDVNRYQQFDPSEGIIQVVGDGVRAAGAIKQHVMQTADMVYIDSDHSFAVTTAQYGIYRALFNPRWIVLDDITLNSEMRDVWALIGQEAGIDACSIIPDVRTRGEGFGVICVR
jgi:hypothetical protein